MKGFIEVTVFYTHKEDVFRIKTLINISNIISVADNSVVISGVEDKFQRVEVEEPYEVLKAKIEEAIK